MDEPVKYICGVGLRCSSLASGKQCGRQPRRSSRRLITLIFAGRNRIIVIRRELPRTKSAGWARRPCRIEHTRTLLSVFDSAAIRTAFLLWFSDLRRHLFLFAYLSFDIDPNSPDKSQQLSPHGRYDLRFVLPLCQQFSVARMQPMLGLPGNFLDLFAQSYLAFQKISAQPRSELIGPGGFDNDASQMCVAGLGDGAPPLSFAAGVFAGNQATVSHQLPSFREARDLSQFGDDGHRSDLRNASQGLQGFDYRAHRWRHRARRLQNRLVQPFDAGDQVLDLVDVVAERSFLRGLLEMNLRFDPLQMSIGPRRFNAVRTPPSVTQQKFTQSMSCSQQVSSCGFPSPHQVSERFVG